MITRLLTIVGALAVITICTSVAHADEDPVPAARDAISKGGYPWYSAESDEVTPITLPGETRRAARPTASRGYSGPSFNFSGMMTILFYVLLVVIVVVVCIVLALAFMDRQKAITLASTEAKVVVTSDAERVDVLPFKVRHPKSDLLTEAELQYKQGNFNEAIIYLYSYQLVQLDKGQVIRLTRGKTNRQYLRETHRNSSLGDLLKRTVVAFEDVFFGDHDIDRKRFEECWQGLNSFKNLQPGGTN